MISENPYTNFNPKISVAGCFIYYKNNILMLKRQQGKFYENTWGCPAGKISAEETSKDAVIREVYEETGILIDSKKLVFIEKLYDRYPDFDFNYFLFKYGLSEKPDVKLRIKENSEYKWLTPEDALKMNLILDEDYCIRKAFNI
jgi:8-oxo-dGTP pyrophosphatase MutT (NUDIX family)